MKKSTRDFLELLEKCRRQVEADPEADPEMHLIDMLDSIHLRLCGGDMDNDVNDLIREIEHRGYRVEFHDWCENADTPGLLGHIKGVTDHAKRKVRISHKANPCIFDILGTLHHELKHVVDPKWDCGSRDVIGRCAPEA